MQAGLIWKRVIGNPDAEEQGDLRRDAILEISIVMFAMAWVIVLASIGYRGQLARQVSVTAQLKAQFPRLAFVGLAFSYLQEWLPHVAQHNVRTGRVDFVGLGRMMLAYPKLPADVLAGRPLRVKSLCRTFSDCPTGPRNGVVSGCFPLDPFYKSHPQHDQLKAAKRHA